VGKYSPGKDNGGETETVAAPRPFDGRRPSRVGAKANLLFLLPFPFVVSAFRGDPVGLALNLGAFAALMLSAWLTREGLLAEEAYEARNVARRPAIPRKIFGSIAMAAGLGLAGLADGSLLNALVFGGIGGLLHLLSFGPDPLKDKGMEQLSGVARADTDRAERAVREAEATLAEMATVIRRAGDPALETRLERFAATARKMFRTVEQDPRDLTASRKFLGVYLTGARDATRKFADLYARTRDPKARADYVALLDDLERNFASKTDTLLLDNRTDLDIEIGVLRERLARENL
jgi:hypothetical protein